MPVYSVSYDFHESDQRRYDKLEESIENHTNGFVKYAETSWIVHYSGNAESLRKVILPNPKPQDRILVIKVVNDRAGWLTDKQWSTLNSLFK